VRPGGAREKGGKHERAVAAKLSAVVPAKRGIGQSRGGGAEVPDVVIPVLHIECKHRAQQSLYGALKQAARDCAKGKVPCAVVRINRKPDVIVFDLDTFVPLFGEFLAWREKHGPPTMPAPPIPELALLYARESELVSEVRRLRARADGDAERREWSAAKVSEELLAGVETTLRNVRAQIRKLTGDEP
jgi:hypothetical protein